MKSIFVIVLSISVATLCAQTPDSGSIGDVKYSILEPDKFNEINGEGWVLLQGQSIEGSDLHSVSGLSKVPDARGVFLRGMNIGRNDDGADSEPDRLVGSLQLDSFQGHQHFKEASLVKPGSRDLPNSPDQRPNQAGATNSAGVHDAGFGAPRISTETRPKNITLYIYIKINK